MEHLEKVRDLAAFSNELGCETRATLLTSIRTELALVRSMCFLARSETGLVRSRDIKYAEFAFEVSLKLATRAQLTLEDREEIEKLAAEITSLGGRTFSQQLLAMPINS